MKCFFWLLSMALSLSVHAQPKDKTSFVLTGQVTNLKEGYVYLRYADKDDKYINDSAALHGGKFRFIGNLAGPTLAGFTGKTVSRGTDDPNYTMLFLEPGAMQVVVTDKVFKEAKLTGSVSGLEYQQLRQQQQKIERRWSVVMDTLHEVNKRSNFQYQELKDWVLTPYETEMKEVQSAFISAHPASYVTAYLLRFSRDMDTDSLRKRYTAFPAKVKQSVYGKAIAEELENRKKGVPGVTAAAFTASDINGQPVNLSDYKGKYVLLDFWASWCVPCRKGNPHLKELYARYKDKGFEIIGVSDDDSRPEAWKGAVAKDELPWKHVLRGVKITRANDRIDIDHTKDISFRYNISSLPTQILVDPSGTIIGRYGDGGEDHASLDEKLQTVFAQNNPKPFVINGRFDGPAGTTLYLYYEKSDGSRAKDSAVVKEGAFQFKGVLAQPTEAALQVKPAGDNKGTGKDRNSRDNNGVELFLEPAVMTLTIDAAHVKDATLTGSKTQADWVEMNQQKAPILREMEPASNRFRDANIVYMDARKAGADEKTLDSLKYKAAARHDELDPYQQRLAQMDYRFFEAHPTSAVTAFYLRYHVIGLSLDSLELFYDRLGSTTQQSNYGAYIAGELKKRRAGAPGSMAASFSTTTIDDKVFNLSDLRGKYVLLDFWASWCVPCRKANPHLKELYAQYKDKGFEVVGVSDDDRDHSAWKKAVEKDGLPWLHVLRGLNYEPAKGYDKTNDISELYGIHSLPTQLLIDPAGKIIGRYGEDSSPHEKLDKDLVAAFDRDQHITFTGLTDTIYNGSEVVIYNRMTETHDSAVVRNGRFVVTVPFREASRYMFYSKYEAKKKGGYSPFGILVTEPGEITMKVDMATFGATVVSGSAENDLYTGYTAVGSALTKKIMDSLALARLKGFIEKNGNSFSAIYLLSAAVNDLDAGELERLYGMTGPLYKETAFGRRIAEKIQAGKITAIGKIAPEFEQPDTSGQVVRLLDFRGKYVLVDFWASWCGPCRQENPNVVKAFAQYKDKGFSVLGVSLDQPGKKEAWLAAIHKDGLTWTQVSDLKFWDNAVARLYGIQAIPQNFLLDPHGKIIAANVNGEELNKKLGEIFKGRLD